MSKELVHNIGAVIKVLFARLRFLAVFLIVGLVVGYWDDIKNRVDKWTRPPVAPQVAGAHAEFEYVCAMHPHVIRSEPGNCPICGMELSKRKVGEKQILPEGVLARVQLSPQRVALANVQTSAAEYKTLVREIHAVGVLDYDETKVAQLSARVAGRADQLFLLFAGQAVKAGDPAYSLYSPDVYTSQREYLLARKRVNELPADAPPDSRTDAASVYNASMQKLVLWGIGRDQLDLLDKEYDQTGKIPSHLLVTSPISGIVIRKDIFEGGYLNVGDRPYTIANLGTLWLEAKIYEQDVPLVQIGQNVEVTVEAYPNDKFAGTVTFRAFQLDPQTRTMDARIEVSNTDLKLRPGMFGDAVIRVAAGSDDTPATMPAHTMPTTAPADAATYLTALNSYMEAEKLLSQDKVENVSVLLHQTVSRLAPLSTDAAIAPSLARLTEAVHKTMNQDLPAVRETFKEVSSAMIEIGRQTKLPADAPAIQVFRCPMKKANWLQPAGATANPFYGSSMLDCGGPVEPLPRAETTTPGPTTQHTAAPTGKMLAIPRSAVIDTGRRKIVYVESTPGVFDMRAIQLGALAGDSYPVVSGLEEGERVVTIGAFLVDSENRLNPSEPSRQ